MGVPAEALRRRPDIRKAERELVGPDRPDWRGHRRTLSEADPYRLGRVGIADRREFIPSQQPDSQPGAGFFVGTSSAPEKSARTSRFRMPCRNKNSPLMRAPSGRPSRKWRTRSSPMLRSNIGGNLKKATAAASRAVKLALDQYKSGIIDFQSVLETQKSLLSFQDQLATSDGTVTSNLIKLYKALGGGWTPMGQTTQ